MFFRLPVIILGLAVTLLSANVLADSLNVVSVESSFPSGFHGQLTALTNADQNALTGFHFVDTKGGDIHFTLNDLQNGVVLVEGMGKEILKLQSGSFSAQEGGLLKLVFLKSFFGSDHRQVIFDFVRKGGILDWAILTDDQQGRDPFDLLRVDVATSFGVPKGVKDIVLRSLGRQVRNYDPNQLPHGIEDYGCIFYPFCE